MSSATSLLNTLYVPGGVGVRGRPVLTRDEKTGQSPSYATSVCVVRLTSIHLAGAWPAACPAACGAAPARAAGAWVGSSVVSFTSATRVTWPVGVFPAACTH